MKTKFSVTPPIVHVVRQYSPAIGGLENFVKSLAEQQYVQGIDVTVITVDRNFSTGEYYSRAEVINGVKIVRLPYFGSNKYPFAFSILKNIPKNSLLHIHCTDFFVDFLALTRFIHRRPMVLSTHGGFFHTKYASRLKILFFNTITRISLSQCKKIIACSIGDEKIFSKVNNSVTLIENGVDVNKFNGIDLAGGIDFLFIGRLSSNKRIDNLIDIFASVRSIFPGIKLYIVGNDYDGLSEKLNRKILNLGVEENVEILNGVEDSELRDIISESGFIVSASEYEGFGMTIIEGMSAGLIPIVNDIPSFNNIVKDSGVGLTIDYSKNESADKVISFIESINFKEDSRRAKEYSTKYSWLNVERNFNGIYRAVLGLDKMNIQGVEIKNIEEGDALKLIEQGLISGNCKIAFANAHTINIASNDSEYKNILNSFITFPDGVGVDINAAYSYGKKFKDNLNGTDFIPKLLCKLKPSRIYVLGGETSVASRARAILSEKYPQHEWVGCHHGYIDDEESSKVADAIRESESDILIVAMGNPLQEKWIDRYFTQSGVKVAAGVGAFLDFTAGDVERAPSWVRSIRSEWVYRLLQEPSRLWKRYLIGNLKFLVRMVFGRV